MSFAPGDKVTLEDGRTLIVKFWETYTPFGGPTEYKLTCFEDPSAAAERAPFVPSPLLSTPMSPTSMYIAAALPPRATIEVKNTLAPSAHLTTEALDKAMEKLWEGARSPIVTPPMTWTYEPGRYQRY